jgi:iron(III) transport system substrate-binding protein
MILNKAFMFACLAAMTLAASASAEEAWQADWDKTVAAAKKEGKLSLYMRGYDAVLRDFSRKYPEIKPVAVTGEGAALGQRILTERRAEKYLADLYVGGPYTVAGMLQPAGAVDPIADKLVLPEVLDPSAWIDGRHHYTDPEKKYNFAFLANPGGGQISYNSKLVTPGEIASYHDLLDAKWKGRIVSVEPAQRSIGAFTQFIYYNPALGADYFRRLFGDMDIAYARNSRQMTDWLATGKFAICFGCLSIEKARLQGLPVANIDTALFREGASYQAASGSISLLNRAPNPNAAKLFINWFLSREGQSSVQKVSDNGAHVNSARIDIPKDDVDPGNRLVAGRAYFDQNDPAWADTAPIDALAKEIMTSKAVQ